MEEMMEKPVMGWLPDLPDFRDYTMEQDEVSEKLKKLVNEKGVRISPHGRGWSMGVF